MRGLAYGRLFRDEDIELESLKNQEAIVVNAIKKGNNTVVDVAMDDNYTGMNFERPGIKKMFELARNGKIDAVFVKDLSRLGRHRTLCHPSKNRHKKAPKNEMNRSISLIYENRPHLFHGLLDNEPLPV